MTINKLREKTLHLYKVLAEEIENGPNDKDFTDPRGGFVSPLLFSQHFINTELTGTNKEKALHIVSECSKLLELVNKEGWSENSITASNILVTKLRNLSWLE